MHAVVANSTVRSVYKQRCLVGIRFQSASSPKTDAYYSPWIIDILLNVHFSKVLKVC